MDRKGFDLLRRRLVRHVTIHRFAFFWARAGRGIKPYYFAIATTVITTKAGIHEHGLSRTDCVTGAARARECMMVERVIGGSATDWLNRRVEGESDSRSIVRMV